MGYPQGTYRGRTIGVTRYVLFVLHGIIPSRLMCACHVCDNPPCIRPSHLFAGTHSENGRDAVKKGRIGGPRVKSIRCPRGHLAWVYSPSGERRCRVCMREYQRLWKAGLRKTRDMSICLHGHSDWRVRSSGIRICAECARIDSRKAQSKKRPGGIVNGDILRHRRIQCLRGHQEWKVGKDGHRRCAACKQEANRRRAVSTTTSNKTAGMSAWS
jgi:hypothetical protein